MNVLRPIGRFLARLWWLLDASRRALLNLLLLGLLLGGLALWWTRGPTPLQERTLLVLDLKGRLVEQYSGSTREQLMARLRGQSLPAQTRLRDVLRALEAAGRDPQIAGVLLPLDDFAGGGLASMGEVAAALQRVKALGKPVYAFANDYDQRSYYLAAQASEIWLHPMGSVGLEGFGGYRNYYKDALDRLGLSANVIRVGTYKNAGEPYFANAPSPATLESESYLLGDLWRRYTAAVEQARKLAPGTLDRSIAALPQSLLAVGGDGAKLAQQEKLVDGIKTWDEVNELLMRRGVREAAGKTFRQVSMGGYLATLKTPVDRPQIGVVVAEGQIVDGEAGAGRVGGASTARLIRQAREDDHIKALVLRVNSPGGSAFASEQIRQELLLTRKAGKPVVISMGDVAASGGYWVSMGADRVIADASTITGSIGVFGMLPTADKLLDKLSVHTGGVTTSWLAGAYDPRRPLDPRMRSLVQAGIQHVYDDFTTKAAQARHKPVAEIEAVAQGRVWSGAQALQRGLVDELGSYADALAAAAHLAKLEATARPVYLEPGRGRLERMMERLADVLAPSLATVLADQLDLLGAPAALGLPPVLQQAQAELGWVAGLGDARKPQSAIVHCLCSSP